MHWLIQSNIFEEDGFYRLVEALERFGLPYSIHKVIPFVGALEPDPNPETDQVIVMGSYAMARIARERGWSPGSFDNENLDYERQLPAWGTRMLNSDAQVYRFDLVPEQPVPFFLRPTLDSKSFTGKVTDWPSFLGWREQVSAGADNGGWLTAETLVMVCAVKPIYREYRLWMVDGRVATASLYKKAGRLHLDALVDEAVIQYGEETARVWSPARSFVLDIAETPDGLRVLEAGCLNAAGYYAADMQKLVMALEDQAHAGSHPVG
jgi:hypothetical protein